MWNIGCTYKLLIDMKRLHITKDHIFVSTGFPCVVPRPPYSFTLGACMNRRLSVFTKSVLVITLLGLITVNSTVVYGQAISGSLVGTVVNKTGARQVTITRSGYTSFPNGTVVSFVDPSTTLESPRCTGMRCTVRRPLANSSRRWSSSIGSSMSKSGTASTGSDHAWR